MSELVIKDKFLHTLAHQEFYEPITLYRPNKSDFHDVVARLLPDDGRVERYSYWWSCYFTDTRLPAQGWKIHVSATPAHASAILDTVARVLLQHRVPFKFVADRMLLSLFNGKSFDRGSSGKFITIYPQHQQQFEQLIVALHEQTIGYWGPYILSDKRFRDSKVIYYRYGGILPMKRAIGDGSSEHVIKGTDGSYIVDERTPYFHLPEGIVDPFADEPAEEDAGEATLKDGRYEIQGVLAFSNPGGVYLARDSETDQTVVIKEGRPYTNVSYRGLDAVQLVKKEHRLLTLLAGQGVSPAPLDFFLDWEHAYIVQEYLGQFTSLRGYLAGIHLTLKTNPSAADHAQFWKAYRAIFVAVADAFRKIHEKGIVFGDISLNNVMVQEQDDGTPTVLLIDFESAYEAGVDLPTHIFTPGYASKDYENNSVANFADDCYAMGSLMLAGLFPMNPLLSLDRSAHRRYLTEFRQDIGLPAALEQLILSLLDGDAEQRPSMAAVHQQLQQPITPLPARIQTANFDVQQLPELIQRSWQYVAAHADPSREDRLYPSDPEVFQSNPLSLAYGALGVAYVGHQLTGKVDPAVRQWINQRQIDSHSSSVGLYNGLAGNAWCAYEIGEFELASQMLESALAHPQKTASPYLFDGMAGLGMTCLKFHQWTRQPHYLQQAEALAQELLAQAQSDTEGEVYWQLRDKTSASLAHGVSGIALFLLYTHLATGKALYLTIGKQAMNWVIKQGHYNDEGGLTWMARSTTPSYTPYWRWGSSGIAKVLLRYWQVSQDPSYLALLDDIHIDCHRKYTIFPGYFFGISGILDWYVDMLAVPGWRDKADAACQRIISGLLLFAIEKDEGIAFPGESLARISCDYGTGGAGICMMLQRYQQRSASPFMLDELLPAYQAAQEQSA
ncbi:class III lanthionine synthetase LanKC [Idiomarina xiamenensis]|uniref:Membrane translocator n=1 Tax=Idiomarina xiamenensis 10-D-4 TaxID=740709 RepID=K2JZP9_9GAMM|nr:class III lanthionine synthetase LanKC [Idiomarina xiamenensis]EKE80928.1 Membrane translocator [Idiomarina xiamenensis 10-D-4]